MASLKKQIESILKHFTLNLTFTLILKDIFHSGLTEVNPRLFLVKRKSFKTWTRLCQRKMSEVITDHELKMCKLSPTAIVKDGTILLGMNLNDIVSLVSESDLEYITSVVHLSTTPHSI